MLINVFFCNIVVVNRFSYYFIALLHLIFSFLCIISLFVPYAYLSIELINCILLSSLALNAVLLILSLNTLCFSLLNLRYDFTINLLFFMNSL